MNPTLVLFDGHCNLCNRFINFLIRKGKGKFYFSTLQGEISQKYLNKEEIRNLTNVVLIRNNKIHKKSSAILYIFLELGFPYSLFFTFILIPAFMRNFCYNILSKNRYSWFGRREILRIPNPEEKEFFLD